MMKPSSLENQAAQSDIGVYNCELHIKFTLIEEKSALSERDRLLEVLLDALSCGTDDFLEHAEVNVEAHEISEVEASATVRRQLIRLRNSKRLA